MSERRRQPKPDQYETYASLLIKLHYEQVGLDEGWDLERFNRLCRMLGCTAHELGALCLIPPGTMNIWLKRTKKFPPYIALHFALIEGWYVEEVLKQPQQPIMPVNLLKAA